MLCLHNFWKFHFELYFLSWSGDWKDLEFKDYNFGAQGQPIAIGYVQPLLEVVFVAPALCIAFLIAKYNLKLMVFDSGARGNPEHLSSDGVQ